MLFFRTVLDVAVGPMILLNPITLCFLGIAAIFLIYSICKTIKRRMEERKSLQTLENDLRNLEKSDKRK